MISVTHVSFGVLLAEFVFTSLGIEPLTSVLALAGIASLLPDIDTPKASLGRIFPWAPWIEHRFGHRQITHSWIFIVFSLIIFSPVAIFSGLLRFAGIIIGVISHIMIDMANPSGVPLFYPHPARFVFPEHKDSRIEVASKKEFVLLAILIFLVSLSTPLSFIGYKSLFYRLSQNPLGAIEEVKKYADSYAIDVRIKGLWKESQLPVEDTFTVLAVQQNGLIITREDKVFFISYNFYSSIIINKINVITKEKIKKEVQNKKYHYCLFDQIEIPENSIVSGYIFYEGYEGIKDLVWGFEEREYHVLKIAPEISNKLILSYAPTSYLKKLKDKGLFISHADLTITTFEVIK